MFGPLAFLAATVAVAAPSAVVIPVDQARTVAGVEVACTGIGQTRNDPRWAAYPVRVEVSDGRNEYLVGEVVSVGRPGSTPRFSVSCDAPWLLLKLEPGAWVVQARIKGAAGQRTATIHTPAKGQIRVVLQFREL